MRIVHVFEVEGHPKDVWQGHNALEQNLKSLAEGMQKEGIKVLYEWREEKGALRSLLGMAGEGAKGIAGYAKELTK